MTMKTTAVAEGDYAALKLAIASLKDHELLLLGIGFLGDKRKLKEAAATNPEKAPMFERFAEVQRALAGLCASELEEQRGRDWDSDLRQLSSRGGWSPRQA